MIKQVSQFHDRKSEKEDENEKKLLDIKRKNFKSLNNTFVLGYYNSGTNWINYLIIENTPPNHIYTLRNQHKFISDHITIESQPKHGKVKDLTLSQKKCVIIYVIRDFDSWINSFLRNKYEVKIKNDIASSTYGWPSMNVYDLYCHIIQTNLNLLRNSKCNYIIVNMKEIQKNKGFIILELLEKLNFKFIKPYKEISVHTKNKKNEINRNFSNCDITKFKLKENKNIEKFIKDIALKPECRLL
tara:strand:- start:1282 stop:2010 length:729 start_codon:yes stop_codon:yes gene_type:complete